MQAYEREHDVGSFEHTQGMLTFAWHMHDDEDGNERCGIGHDDEDVYSYRNRHGKQLALLLFGGAIAAVHRHGSRNNSIHVILVPS